MTQDNNTTTQKLMRCINYVEIAISEGSYGIAKDYLNCITESINMLNQDVENFITSAGTCHNTNNTTVLVNALRDEGFNALEIGEIMDHSLEWVLRHLCEGQNRGDLNE